MKGISLGVEEKAYSCFQIFWCWQRDCAFGVWLSWST
jgi:hypothetical protein